MNTLQIIFLIDIWILSGLVPYLLFSIIEHLLTEYVIDYINHQFFDLLDNLLVPDFLSEIDFSDIFVIIATSIMAPGFGIVSILMFLYDIILNTSTIIRIYKAKKKYLQQKTEWWKLKKFGGWV